MRVLLISTYELGRQPFGLASPAAWIRQTGVDVECLDLALQNLDENAVRIFQQNILDIPEVDDPAEER